MMLLRPARRIRMKPGRRVGILRRPAGILQIE